MEVTATACRCQVACDNIPWTNIKRSQEKTNPIRGEKNFLKLRFEGDGKERERRADTLEIITFFLLSWSELGNLSWGLKTHFKPFRINIKCGVFMTEQLSSLLYLLCWKRWISWANVNTLTSSIEAEIDCWKSSFIRFSVLNDSSYMHFS